MKSKIKLSKLIASSGLIFFLLNPLSFAESKKLEEKIEETITYESVTYDSVREYDKNFFNESIPLKEIENLEKYVKENLIPIEKMYDELKKSKIVLLADVHASIKNHQNMIEIIKNINDKNLVVGLEMFRTDEQKYIDDFINNKITLDKLVSCCGYDVKRMEKLGYLNIIRFLKKNKIKFVGVEIPESITITNKENGFKSITIFYNPYNFYSRDITTAKIVKSLLNKNKKIVVIIGEKHCEEKNLPYIIKNLTNITPLVVSQRLYPITNYFSADILDKEYKKFRKMGLRDGFVIKFKNTFYINTKLTKEEIDYYYNSSFIQNKLE